MEKVSSATTTLCGAPIDAHRIDGADVLDGRHLAFVAIDLDLELGGGEIGDLAAVAVERRDVDRHQLHAGAEHGLWGLRLGAWRLGLDGHATSPPGEKPTQHASVATSLASGPNLSAH